MASRTVKDTSDKDITAKVNKLRESFDSGKTLSYEWRYAELLALRKMCKENEPIIADALNKDLGRGNFEAIALELVPVYMEIDHALGALKSWMRPTPRMTPLGMCPSVSEVHNVPFGVSLIISPFNYPFSLCFSPLVGSISAGNTTLIKPSEMTAACEKVMYDLVPKYLDMSCTELVFGGIEPTKFVLSQCFDKIFFTGSTRVGKIVMKAAAENLTNITMELGGKSPCIIDKSCTNLELACKRILWGKFCNSGQTCIAPDYLIVHEDIYDQFIETATKRLNVAFGDDPSKSPDYCRVVSEFHVKRLESMAIQAVNAGAAVIGSQGGSSDTPNAVAEGKGKGKGKISKAAAAVAQQSVIDVRHAERYCAPTFLTGITLENWSEFDVMKEEIFGPLLPILRVSQTQMDNIGALCNNIHKHPLALYIFSKDKSMINNTLASCTSGGAVVNDVVYQFANGNLPFGGIGPSGMGCAHGDYNFECFSHKKAVMRRDDHTILDIPQRYPPYTPFALKLFELNAKLPNVPYISERLFNGTVAVGVLAFALYGAIKMDWVAWEALAFWK